MVVGTAEPVVFYDTCRRVGDQVRRVVDPAIMTTGGLTYPSGGFLTQVRSGGLVSVTGPAVASTPLTDAQQRAVDVLVQAGRLE